MSASHQILAILRQVLEEYGDRLKIHGGSKLLVSDGTIAKALYEVTEDVRTPYGPTLAVASQETPNQALVEGISNAEVLAADKLAMDHYTHAVFGVSGEDPKYIFGGIKHTIYALQPKGYAIVISLKQETKQSADGEFQLSLEDKMKYQSKGRINNLEDCLYYAGFERGRVKTFEQKAEVGGKEIEAQVFLAMKWDQLTA